MNIRVESYKDRYKGHLGSLASADNHKNNFNEVLCILASTFLLPKRGIC